MEKNVRITITGTQKAKNEPPQTMEFITDGVLRCFGPKIRVSYAESDLIGMEGVTTTFEVSGSCVALERSGKIESRMEFVKGETTESLYTVEGGALMLGVTARRVEPDLNENGGSIYLEYGVSIEQTFLGLNTYQITVCPASDGAVQKAPGKEQTQCLKQ